MSRSTSVDSTEKFVESPSGLGEGERCEGKGEFPGCVRAPGARDLDLGVASLLLTLLHKHIRTRTLITMLIYANR